MRILIDPDLCTGHGRCYSLSPDLFDSDEEGRGVVLVGVLAGNQEAAARSAVLSCPEQAITVVED
jgi:ferredoxin